MTAPRSLALVGALALTAAAPPAAGSITLYNESGFTVTHVYISDCDTDDWEDDLLGPTEVLSPGESVAVALDTGCWDLMAQLDNGRTLETYSVGVGPYDEVEWVISN